MTTELVPEYTEGLPPGVSVEIDTVHDVRYVTIVARLHMNKRFRLPHSYSASAFSVQRILRDSDFLKYLSRYRLD